MDKYREVSAAFKVGVVLPARVPRIDLLRTFSSGSKSGFQKFARHLQSAKEYDDRIVCSERRIDLV
jgi:hypothetical protein